MPAVAILRRVWLQNFVWIEGQLRWRENDNIPPPALFIGSPYDIEAHYAQKRSTTWVGYKVHLTETCDTNLPHLIAHVETTTGPVSDDARTATIHAALARIGLLPSQHLVDTGYIDAKLLLESQRFYGIDLLGPVRANYKWQARQATGFEASQFLIHWEEKHATCPEGHRSNSWTPAIDRRKNEVIKIKFATKDCRSCPSQAQCTYTGHATRRTLTIRPQEQYFALQRARARQATKDFAKEYRLREGIESTLSQGIRVMELRRSRYLGAAKTHLQHLATAAAINVVRSVNWWNEKPRAGTHSSALVRLLRV